MNIEKMIYLAKEAANNAHSPYSNFMVGATLVTDSGKIYTGCNIENQGIQAICSERVAFAKALSEGEREFKAIFVVAKMRDAKYFKETLPCGYCRQFMSEFCKPDFEIYSYDEEKNEVKKYTLQELLPYGFTL